MHETVRQFVERMGLLMEAEGLPRSAGRIFGYLLLSDCPCSLDELAETLQVSKASVSTNARLLEQCGMLERSSALGERRDFYRLHSDAWERMLQVARRRWEGMRALIAETATSLPVQMHTARERLREAERFHELLLDEADTLIGRWRANATRPHVLAPTAAPSGGGIAAD